ncbi:MAG: Hpt domain-containing protein, partial [Planctomycetota bacterium]
MSNDPPKVGGDAMSGEDFADYLPIYLDETEEQLDDLVETMLALEQNPGDRASLQTAFRLLHSMKGASGMMGLDQITALTHHLETRFERLRSGTLQLDRTTMNLTLRCIDFLKNCNDQVRNGEPISTPADLLGELQRLEDSSER